MLALLLEAAFRSFLLGIVVWLGIALLRGRGTHAEASAWTGVLTASFAMPVLMQLTPITIILPAPLSSIGTVFHISPLTELIAVWLSINLLRARDHGEAMAWLSLLAVSFTMQLAAQFMAIAAVFPASPLNSIISLVRMPPTALLAPSPPSLLSYAFGLLTAFYVAIALVMLLRLAVGLFLTWRLFRQAQPIHMVWTKGYAVRVSPAIVMPGTFGSTIILPKEYVEWSSAKRNAVIAHESSHVRRGDFYLQIVAAIHRCLFWFSPLAWFLEARLALLAEMASDDAAVSVVGDRPVYADFLFQFAAKESAVTTIAMARPEKIVERIDRVLAQAAIPPALNGRKRLLLYASLFPLVTGVAGLSLAAQPQTTNAPQAKHVISIFVVERSANEPERPTGRNPSPYNWPNATSTSRHR